MFKLMKLSQDLYRVHNPDRGISTEVGADEVVEIMEALGAPEAETRIAMFDMEERSTNCADFGRRIDNYDVFGFIFSDRREVA